MNVEPEAMSELKLAMAQLSAAAGSLQLTAAEQLPASLVWVRSPGRPLIVGASLSVTVTVKVEVVVLPAASVAV